MKLHVLLLSCLLVGQSALAKNEMIDVNESNEVNISELELIDEVNTKVKISDVKNLVSSQLDNGSTCLDEYLKRRKQLLVKFAFTPVTVSASVAASIAAGGMTGVAIAKLTGVGGDWTALGYFIGGAMIGTATTIVVLTADTTMSGLNYYDNDLMMKALGEHYLNRDHRKFEELYLKATKKMTVKPSFEEFVDRVVSMDQSGELCDGSLVKQPRIRLGTKLKYKLARPKDLQKAF